MQRTTQKEAPAAPHGGGKTVELRLPLNPANPKDTEVTVGLNGRFWKIQRGYTVKLPAGVAEVLANSERQTAAAMDYINGAAQS